MSFYSCLRILLIIVGLPILISSTVSYGQNIPSNVTNIVEGFLMKDSSNTIFKDLVKNKTYYLKKIQPIEYDSSSYTVYVFGDVSTHIFFYHLLFVDNTSGKYFIIGEENNMYQNLKQLYNVLLNSVGVTSENTNLCYGYIIENYSEREPKIGTIKR